MAHAFREELRIKFTLSETEKGVAYRGTLFANFSSLKFNLRLPAPFPELEARIKAGRPVDVISQTIFTATGPKSVNLDQADQLTIIRMVIPEAQSMYHDFHDTKGPQLKGLLERLRGSPEIETASIEKSVDMIFNDKDADREAIAQLLRKFQ